MPWPLPRKGVVCGVECPEPVEFRWHVAGNRFESTLSTLVRNTEGYPILNGIWYVISPDRDVLGEGVFGKRRSDSGDCAVAIGRLSAGPYPEGHHALCSELAIADLDRQKLTGAVPPSSVAGGAGFRWIETFSLTVEAAGGLELAPVVI